MFNWITRGPWAHSSSCSPCLCSCLPCVHSNPPSPVKILVVFRFCFKCYIFCTAISNSQQRNTTSLPYTVFSCVAHMSPCRHSVGKHTGEMQHHLVLLSLACPHGPRGVLAAWSFPGRITASPGCWALPAAHCFCRISKMTLPWSIYIPVFFFYVISSSKAVWGYFNIFLLVFSWLCLFKG